ncbi:MAG: hypothetical protein WCR67_06935, partial [Bacilli bacterium]
MKNTKLGVILPVIFGAAIISTGFVAWTINNNALTSSSHDSNVQTKLANDTTDGGLVMTYGSEKVTPTQVAKRVSVVFDQESNNG